MLIVAGCAGYRLGPVNGLAAGETSIQVSPFLNRTLQPRLTDAVTTQLRQQVQKDGTFRLASRNDGDIVLSGALIKYSRVELSFTSGDTLTANDYRLSLTAQVTARDRISGRMLLDQPVTGYTLVRVGTDLTSSERQALPLLAEDLARNVVALLAEGTW
jgi:hypothetical protein